MLESHLFCPLSIYPKGLVAVLRTTLVAPQEVPYSPLGPELEHCADGDSANAITS